MNLKFLLVSGGLFVIVFFYSRHLRNENKLAKEKNDGSGPTISNLTKSWGVVIILLILSIIFFLKGLFNIE